MGKDPWLRGLKRSVCQHATGPEGAFITLKAQDCWVYAISFELFSQGFAGTVRREERLDLIMRSGNTLLTGKPLVLKFYFTNGEKTVDARFIRPQ